MSSGLSPSNPVVSPLCQPGALPAHHAPTHITAAGLDYLLQEDISYAVKLRDADIDTVMEILPGVPHGFTWVARANVTKQWIRHQVKVLDEAFKPQKQE
jgi:acetyl esterase/lipase